MKGRVVTVLFVIFSLVLVCVSRVSAQLQSELNAYSDLVSSVVSTLEQNNTQELESLIDPLIESDIRLGKTLDSAILKVRAALISTDPYEGTDQNFGDTTHLITQSALQRYLSVDLVMAWLAAEEMQQEDREETKQIAISALNEALAVSRQAVENLMPLLESIAEMEFLPPTVVLRCPDKLTLTSRYDVRIPVTIINGGDAPAKGVEVVLEETNDSPEMISLRSKIGTIPGGGSVVHTFFLQVSNEITKMSVKIWVQSINAIGDFGVTVLDFSTP